MSLTVPIPVICNTSRTFVDIPDRTTETFAPVPPVNELSISSVSAV